MGELKAGNMKSTIVLLLFFVGVAYSSCPGCLSEVDMNTVPEIEEIKNIASATSTKLISGNSDGNCRVNLASLVNFQSQVVAGTIFKFDAISKKMSPRMKHLSKMAQKHIQNKKNAA